MSMSLCSQMFKTTLNVLNFDVNIVNRERFNMTLHQMANSKNETFAICNVSVSMIVQVGILMKSTLLLVTEFTIKLANNLITAI